MARIIINAEHQYDVVVGAQWRDDITPFLTNRTKVAFITSVENRDLIGEMPKSANQSIHIEIADGENGKSLASYLDLLRRLGEAGLTRSDLIVGIGGGAVTDVAGFAAATWLRGIDWISIPTTIAGAVDAAIGGKTGVNTEHGKNLVGSFHSPRAVLIDLSWFSHLSDRDFAAGLSEVIKCGFISDASILDLLEGKDLETVRRDTSLVEYLILKAIRVKAGVVSRDFKESGEREILNYGHTLGHAIERSSGYSMRHGECVAIGMVFAAELAHSRGLINEELVERHRRILTSMHLPIAYQRQRWNEIEPLLLMDKKVRGRTLRFVLLDGLGSTTRLPVESSDELLEIYERVSS